MNTGQYNVDCVTLSPPFSSPSHHPSLYCLSNAGYRFFWWMDDTICNTPFHSLSFRQRSSPGDGSGPGRRAAADPRALPVRERGRGARHRRLALRLLVRHHSPVRQRHERKDVVPNTGRWLMILGRVYPTNRFKSIYIEV